MNNLVIVIGREYGSGGREIAEKIASRLKIPCYDKLIIDRIARNANIATDIVEKMDENNKADYSCAIFNSYYGVDVGNISNSLSVKMHVERFNVIKDMAKKSSCVIVGRAADDILRGQCPVLSIFISADQADRVSRVMERNNVDEKQALKMIKRIDKTRAAFYNNNSSKTWGDAATYDLCLKSDVLGIDDTVENLIAFILSYAKKNNLSI